MKRAFDVIVAGFALLVISPLLILTAAYVRIALGKPVLFRHNRPGKDARVFTLYKFRTMRDLRDEEGRPLPDEQRMAKFGRFLRHTSIDELPELVNVLKGDMSLVGPRPLLTEYLPLYDSRQSRRHEVRPGVTGWAQINGRNAVSWQVKFEYDIWYVENQSFLLDLKILAATIHKVFGREGITETGHATIRPFAGND